MTSFVSGQVTMSIVNLAGKPVKKVSLGIPFILNVQVRDTKQASQDPKIAGIELFNAQRIGVYISTINGVSSVKYSYQLRADRQGKFTFGPAIVAVNGKKYSSNRVVVEVVEQPISQDNRHDGIRALQLFAEKERMFLGQTTRMKLRLFYDDPEITLCSINAPRLQDVKQFSSSGPFKGRDWFKGKECSYIEWHWNIRPEKNGTFVIPAHSIEYEQSRNAIHNTYSMLFGALKEKKRIYSNALKLKVKPLPQTDKHIIAIGDFQRATAQIKPALVSVGKAMTLKITLEGAGDVILDHAPDLPPMGEWLKWYPSQDYIVQSSDMNHEFEYVIQACNVGAFEIPALEFWVFNLSTHKYDVLKTSPLTISVIARQSDEKQFKTHEQAGIAAAGNALACVVVYAPSIISHIIIPWIFFWMLFLLPWAIMIILFVLQCQHTYRKRYDRDIRARNAFKRAQQAVQAIEKEENQTKLYHAFVTLFADRLKIPETRVSIQELISYPKNHGMRSKDFVQWKEFVGLIEQYAFDKHEIYEHDEDIFNQAAAWISKLSKYLTIFMILTVSLSFAQSPIDLFDDGLQAYDAGKWQQAYDTFDIIPNKSAELYFNMGNCLYNMQQEACAVAYWRKAQRIGSYALAIRVAEQLYQVQEKYDMPIVGAELTFIDRLFLSIALLWYQLILIVLSMAMLYIFVCMSPGINKIVSMLGLLCALNLFGVLLYCSYVYQRKPEGIVVASGAMLRVGPEDRMPTLQEVPYCASIVICDKQQDWFKISYNQMVGWIQKTYVQEV